MHEWFTWLWKHQRNRVCRNYIGPMAREMIAYYVDCYRRSEYSGMVMARTEDDSVGSNMWYATHGWDIPSDQPEYNVRFEDDFNEVRKKLREQSGG